MASLGPNELTSRSQSQTQHVDAFHTICQITKHHTTRNIHIKPRDTCSGYFHSLWPSDAIWRQRSASTLIKAMACYQTAPLPEPKMTYRYHQSFGIHLRAISQEIYKITILDISLKMTKSRVQPKHPRTNELTAGNVLWI